MKNLKIYTILIIFLLIISIKPIASENVNKSGDTFSEYLLIPNSTDDVISLYDPYDGTYLGDLCTIPLIHGSTSTPKNAIGGPDGNIYVSDQVQDAIFVFSNTGAYLYEYANSTDGLNNIRGIDFRGNHLFVTSGDDYVAEFDGPHNRLPDFINDGTDPFDIYFLENGTALLSDIQGSTDNVRYYNSDGTLNKILFSSNFPEQIQHDSIEPGNYLNIGFSTDLITDFDLSGTIYQTTVIDVGSGIYRLGNGNLLAATNNGVFEIEPGTGNVIDQENTGYNQFIEYYSMEVQSNDILITNLFNNWNLIGIPFNQSINKNNLTVEYNNNNSTWSQAVTAGIVSDFIFGWSRAGQSYTFTDFFQPGYGYWIYAYEPCILWVENITIEIDDYVTNLYTNWNTVGIPHNEAVSKTSFIVNDVSWGDAVSTGIINDYVFGWNKAGQSYLFADIFEPGEAYWVFAYQPCLLKRVVE